MVSVILAVSLLVVAPSAATSTERSHKDKSCPTKNVGESQVTRKALSIDSRSARVVVYTRVNGEDHSMFGCYRKTGKRTLLDSWYSCECSVGDQYGSNVRVAGRFVALNDADYGSPSDTTDQTGSLRVVDLLDARVLLRYDTGGYVDELAFKRNGSAAFVFNTIRNSSSRDFDGRLVRVDRTGTEVLDQQAVEEGSLALAPNGTHIYWRTGGQYRGAPID